MIDEHGHCPHCGADWDGGPIPEKHHKTSLKGKGSTDGKEESAVPERAVYRSRGE